MTDSKSSTSSVDSEPIDVKENLFQLSKTFISALLIAGMIRFLWFQPFNIPSPSMEKTLLAGDYIIVVKYPYGYSHFSIPFSPPIFKGRIFFKSPNRGDVVVFRKPDDTSVDFIKRIVGLPGDIIQIRDGLLYINGQAVKTQSLNDLIYPQTVNSKCNKGNYSVDLSFKAKDGEIWCRIIQYRETLPNGVSYTVLNREENSIGDNTRPFLVPPGHYFAMGDNRDDSADSRFPPYTNETGVSGIGFVPEENLIGRASFIFLSVNGEANLWEVWKWYDAIRWDRMFQSIN